MYGCIRNYGRLSRSLLEEKVIDADARIEELEDALSTRGHLIRRQQDATTERKLEITVLRELLKERETHIDRLEAEMTQRQRALDNSQSQSRRLRAAVSDADARIEELEDALSTRGHLIRRQQDATTERKLEITVLRELLKDREIHIDRLEAEMTQRQRALDNSQSQVKQLRATVSDRDAEIQKLRWATTPKTSFECSPSQARKLQDPVADSQSQVKQLKTAVMDRDAHIWNLKWEVACGATARKRDRSTFESCEVQLRQDVADRRSQIKELKAKVADLDNQLKKEAASLRDLVDFSYNAGVKNQTPWNEDLRKPCAYHRYIVQRYDEDLAAYDTDENGLVIRVQALLSRVYKYEERNTFRDEHKKDGRYAPGDENGHLIAALFGGCGETINIVPMTSILNQHRWGALERGWQDYLNANPNCQMFVDIKVLYGNNNDSDGMPFGRPTSFYVSEYRVDANGYVEEHPRVWEFGNS